MELGLQRPGPLAGDHTHPQLTPIVDAPGVSPAGSRDGKGHTIACGPTKITGFTETAEDGAENAISITQIAAGANHLLALDATGHLWAIVAVAATPLMRSSSGVTMYMGRITLVPWTPAWPVTTPTPS